MNSTCKLDSQELLDSRRPPPAVSRLPRRGAEASAERRAVAIGPAGRWVTPLLCRQVSVRQPERRWRGTLAYGHFASATAAGGASQASRRSARAHPRPSRLTGLLLKRIASLSLARPDALPPAWKAERRGCHGVAWLAGPPLALAGWQWWRAKRRLCRWGNAAPPLHSTHRCFGTRPSATRLAAEAVRPLAGLARLSALEHLCVSKCDGFDDDALQALRALPSLRSLRMGWQPVASRTTVWRVARCKPRLQTALHARAGATASLRGVWRCSAPTQVSRRAYGEG